MARRVLNLNGELDSENYYTENMDQPSSYYSSEQSSHENYDHGTGYDYSIIQHAAYDAQQAYETVYNSHYARNDATVPGRESNFNSFNNFTPNQNIQTRHAPVIQASFPIAQPSPLFQQSSPASNYGIHINYSSSSEKSWISAFSSGGFDNEPPLLEGKHIEISIYSSIIF